MQQSLNATTEVHSHKKKLFPQQYVQITKMWKDHTAKQQPPQSNVHLWRYLQVLQVVVFHWIQNSTYTCKLNSAVRMHKQLENCKIKENCLQKVQLLNSIPDPSFLQHDYHVIFFMIIKLWQMTKNVTVYHLIMSKLMRIFYKSLLYLCEDLLFQRCWMPWVSQFSLCWEW